MMRPCLQVVAERVTQALDEVPGVREVTIEDRFPRPPGSGHLRCCPAFHVARALRAQVRLGRVCIRAIDAGAWCREDSMD